MLTTKTFFRKSKRGNIFKIVREHYLRDDIWCGSEGCNTCNHRHDDVLLSDENPGLKSSLFPNPHYLVLDTNIVLDQIHILEENVLCNVIILYTVFDEVQHRSSNVHKKLKDLMSDPGRRFYVFVNEHHKDTYVERVPGEKINDRNDRAIRTAVKWYNKHLTLGSQNPVTVILLTDDAENKRKAIEDGIPAVSMEEYIASLDNPGLLLDKINKRNYILEGSNKEPLFPLHLAPAQIHEGIKDGSILQGTFLASRDNFLEGSVNVESIEKFVLVQGRAGLNRAIDGDIVALKLLPEDEWSAPCDLVLQDEEEDPGDILDDEKLVIEQAPAKPIEKTPTGIIVGIIKRKWRQYCGILQPSPLRNAVKHLFVPAERKIPKVRIETRQVDILSNQRIIVAIDSWPRHSRYPLGHFVRALGKIGDKETENEVLLLEHDVPHSRFSDAVLSFLPKMPWTITDEDLAQREDLRHLDICSVDPPGCTDIDDALHCRDLPNGNLEVGVHIADVSHFIKPGNALDKEAALRGTTVYLVDKRIDMVPELLSSNLCSLRGNEERFAFSCIWEVDHEANIIATRFCKSVIRSRQAMTYEEAQLKIDDKSQQDSLAKSLRQLNKLAKILKQRRLENGALVLASPEIRFQVDSETHDPIDVEAKKIRETNSMIEEFMLLANISVAQKIVQEFPEFAMLRRHPEPPQANFDPLIKAGRNQGFDIITTTGKELAQSLNDANKEDNPYFNTMLRILATRCMMQAVYFVSGMLQPKEYFHYGLACPIYTHFTSPIRRYADIIVHRLLAVCIGADATYPELLDKKKNHALCHNLNYRNRMAQYAGRASVALNTHLFFKNKVQTEEGYILFVRKNALQILIPKFGMEGTIYLSHKGETLSVNFHYNDEDHSQRCGDIVFHAFDPVVVQLSLDSSNIQHEKLVFKLVKPQIPGFSVPEPTMDAAEDVEMQEVSKRKVEEVSDEVPKKKKGKKKKKKN
ncbi:exosome complex exonuclease RRP44 [Orussus abietinus]|uniref:exosome complex exonuclease RRP44 n=1 Tax=Orussus abietinus TaxID=222816 RepID=UPI000626C001|nr:exosome complex exonuclease RRP44 [Orussus abietinus]XP_012277146.1 exosome complex exonuclease RRP44 [Orussus abietinus]XP_012277147.1 exosome complex exonuclease RRP44 [Orussus abietinus]